VERVSENKTPKSDSDKTQELAVDRKLLEVLVCPLTKTRLTYDAQKNELVSNAARLAFPIKKGIPLMTPDAARQLDDNET